MGTWQQEQGYISHYVSYKLKLIKFNSTQKYKDELNFLYSLLKLNEHDTVLDYGCGIGTSVEILRKNNIAAFGYDLYRWVDDNPSWFSSTFNMKFKHVYFMHSLAHIDNVMERLISLREYLTEDGRVTVITPNLSWIVKQENANYLPDNTVVSHFNLLSLQNLFEDAGYTVLNIGQFGKTTDNVNERLFIQCRK